MKDALVDADRKKDGAKGKDAIAKMQALEKRAKSEAASDKVAAVEKQKEEIDDAWGSEMDDWDGINLKDSKQADLYDKELEAVSKRYSTASRNNDIEGMKSALSSLKSLVKKGMEQTEADWKDS